MSVDPDLMPDPADIENTFRQMERVFGPKVRVTEFSNKGTTVKFFPGVPATQRATRTDTVLKSFRRALRDRGE